MCLTSNGSSAGLSCYVLQLTLLHIYNVYFIQKDWPHGLLRWEVATRAIAQQLRKLTALTEGVYMCVLHMQENAHMHIHRSLQFLRWHQVFRKLSFEDSLCKVSDDMWILWWPVISSWMSNRTNDFFSLVVWKIERVFMRDRENQLEEFCSRNPFDKRMIRYKTTIVVVFWTQILWVLKRKKDVLGGFSEWHHWHWV